MNFSSTAISLKKGLCHKLAKEAGVSHAQLPLDSFVQMKSRKVLTIDQVFSIIGEVASNGKTWTDAIMKILPSRKEAMQISAEVEESKAENVDEVQKEIHNKADQCGLDSKYIEDHTNASDLEKSETALKTDPD